MLNKHKCDRTISSCKEERPSFQSKLWWNRLFKKLEEESSIPPEKRVEVLEAIFPNYLLRRIVDLIDLDKKSKEKVKGYATLKFPCEGPLTFPPISPGYTYGSKEKEKEEYSDSISISSFTSTSSMENNVPLKQVGKKNPYLKFFQTRHDRASIWRPMPPLSLADMNLVQKADAITERPPEKRVEVLEAIFPNYLLRRIVDLIDLDKKSKEKVKGYATLKFPCEGPLTFPPISPGYTYGSKEKEKEEYSDSISISSFTSTSSMENNVPLKQVGKKNPYLKFFQTRHDRASIWRPMPPLSLADMNLVQKADAITERIAEEFVKWLQEVGGEATSNLSVQTIISMFEIGFNTHAAKSLCVRLKEMPTVTDLVAKKRNVPGMAKRASLLRQINRDIEASKMEPKRTAFGRSLPSYMQRVPNKEDIAKKWLQCQNVPMKLKTMQTVWEGITHLRSTRAYCEWLVNHPEIKPPQFLVENNMLDLLVLHAQRPSFDEEDIGADEIAGGTSELIIKGFSRPDLVSKMDTAMSRQALSEVESKKNNEMDTSSRNDLK